MEQNHIDEVDKGYVCAESAYFFNVVLHLIRQPLRAATFPKGEGFCALNNNLAINKRIGIVGDDVFKKFRQKSRNCQMLTPALRTTPA